MEVRVTNNISNKYYQVCLSFYVLPFILCFPPRRSPLCEGGSCSRSCTPAAAAAPSSMARDLFCTSVSPLNGVRWMSARKFKCLFVAESSSMSFPFSSATGKGDLGGCSLSSLLLLSLLEHLCSAHCSDERSSDTGGKERREGATLNLLDSTLCFVPSVVMFCLVFFWKFLLLIQMHSSCSISPTPSETCKNALQNITTEAMKHSVEGGWWGIGIFYRKIMFPNGICSVFVL